MLVARIKQNCFADRSAFIDKQNKLDLNKTQNMLCVCRKRLSTL